MSLIQKQSSLTMSSREIAELVESRHDNVKRTVERLIDKELIQLTPLEEVKNHLGQSVYEYRLNKRDSYVVVAQLSPEFTARLVDRWQELESQQVKLPNVKELALMVIKAEEEKEQLLIENQRKDEIIEEQRPAVEFIDRFVDGSKLYTVTEASKILNFKRKDFVARLERDKYLYRTNGALVPYANPKCASLFEVKTSVAGNGHNYTQTKITAQGLNKFAEIYSTELLEVAA